MPRGGQNRKPRGRKIIQGTFRNDRNPPREPTPPAVPTAPKPPAGMNRWARGAWKRLAAELTDQELLTSLDLMTLELLCAAYGDWKVADQAVFHPLNPLTGKRERRNLEQYLSGRDTWIKVDELSADVVVSLRRNSQTAPELAERNRAYATYRAYMAEFGLSPASRNRINLPARREQGQDPMEKMLDEA